jgi:predicted permease
MPTEALSRVVPHAQVQPELVSRPGVAGIQLTQPSTEEGLVGISLGGIVVIAGIVLMFVWSFWIGLIVTLIGLIVFGGFARDKWY